MWPNGRPRSDVQLRTAARLLGLSVRQVQRLQGVSLVRTGGPRNAQVTVESLAWVYFCRTQPQASVDMLRGKIIAVKSMIIRKELEAEGLSEAMIISKQLDALSDEEFAFICPRIRDLIKTMS